MSIYNQQQLHKHMHVYSSDNQNLGKVDEVYEDSFQLHPRHLLSKSRYFPYAEINSIDAAGVHLRLTAEEALQPLWEKRPDYEHHLGDPTQIFYDRGHGVRDPFDSTNPDES
jgi:hypothetical protein